MDSIKLSNNGFCESVVYLPDQKTKDLTDK